MSERPVTPYNTRLYFAALESMRMRPSAWTLIDRHISEQRAKGVDFGCWTADGEAKFRSGDIFSRLGITTIIKRSA